MEGDSRHRKTEQEEDEELLSDLNAAKSNVIQFDESPNYIKSGKMRDYQVFKTTNLCSQIHIYLFNLLDSRPELDDWTPRERDQRDPC